MKWCLLFLISACATQKVPKTEENLVSIDVALDQAQASYLLGCVEAFRSLKLGPSFESCRDKSLVHRRELEKIQEMPVEVPYTGP